MKRILLVLLCFFLILPTAALGNQNQEKVKKSSKSEWELVWSDEFEGKEIDRTKWTYDLGNWIVDEDGNGVAPGWGNNEKEFYTDSSENAYVKDGKLIIQAKKEKVTDQFGTYDYTSARLKSKGLFSKKYGRFDIKAKLPVGKGLWPAIWMLPEEDKYDGWAASGEIDIMESWGSKPHTVAGTIHYGEVWPNNKYTGKEYELPKNRGIDSWHTYSLEWEPGELRWYVDGKLYQTQNNWYSKGRNNATKYAYPAPFDQNFHLIMNLAVGGWFDGDPDESTIFPKKMEIDYVRVYDLKKREYQEPTEPVVEKIVLPEGAKQPLEDGNYIYDNQYEQPITEVDAGGKALNATYWNFVHLPDFGGNGSINVDSINGVNYAKISPSSPGNQLYSLQLIQNLSLGKGGKYKVSFDAKSTGNRNMMVKLGAGAERGWTKYSNEETISLTDQLQSYEFTFDMLAETDLASRLEFNLGNNGLNPVWIGNVRVEDVTGQAEDENGPKQPLPNGNHVYNGTFDQGRMDRMTYWNLVTNQAVATASVDEGTRELQVKVTDGGAHPTDVQVVQKGMYLLKGNEYKATFKARAEQPTTIQVDVRSKDGLVSYSEAQTINLTTEMAEYSLVFTMPNEVTDTEGQLIFNLGGQDNVFYLDDVVLLKTSTKIDYGQVDLFPLKNGQFANGFDSWGSYVHYDANAALSVNSQEEAMIEIGHEGNETWSVILEQSNLKLSKGVEYIVSFDARSSALRDVEVTVENAQYARFLSEKPRFTNEMSRYSYTFTMPSDDTTSLKFLLGKNSNSPVGNHTIHIDNVVLQVNNAPQPEPVPTTTPGIDNGDFNNGDAHWSSWWGDQWSGYAVGSATVENNEMKVSISQVGGASYAPQVYQKDLYFEKGSTYTVSFDARADVARKVNVNIGKELTTDPWFIAYAPTSTFDLTSEMKTYTVTFTMTEETYQDGKLVFELGNIANGNAATNVFIDNVRVVKE
ncbi:carbohydrate binding domain-containing protein [Bacillus pinisoli]|uniref:carbohydrate binding domain-containing protein n=1 Tax=Bacillus pinisoli TaxID=2901866 RepID=UPI001FF5489C|nr:carbohydrate binding domain-containing protein [Bacillus pinisoli]